MVLRDAVAPAHFYQRALFDEALDVCALAIGKEELSVNAAGRTKGQHEGFHFLVFHAQGLAGVRVAA